MSTEVAPTDVPSAEAVSTHASEAENRWYREGDQGAKVSQFTPWSFAVGSVLGTRMARSNR